MSKELEAQAGILESGDKPTQVKSSEKCFKAERKTES